MGAGKSQEIVFCFEDYDIVSVIQKARQMPGVKHDRYALSAERITEDEYIKERKISAYDKYIGNIINVDREV